MVNVSVATFAVGVDAATSVGRYLKSSAALLVNEDRRTPSSLEQLTKRFNNLLRASPDGFDTYCHPKECRRLRVVWEPCQKAAGTLYIVRDGSLQTISLLLSGANPKADVEAIERVGRALSPIDAYYEPLAIVRFAPRPMIATFCSQVGGLDETIDRLQLAFASVFFHRCGIAVDQPGNADQLTCVSPR
jgi:hypothetical protein